jgi:hypothetical protein
MRQGEGSGRRRTRWMRGRGGSRRGRRSRPVGRPRGPAAAAATPLLCGGAVPDRTPFANLPHAHPAGKKGVENFAAVD